MISKKYQVFVSSTFIDLKEERQKVFEILLSADCIPAGMEAFCATDNEQFEIIKKVIELCDYYILILGNRYGSINSETNKSYTEMEYEYAISQGIPVLVFEIQKAESSVEDVIKQGKLAEFKQKVMNNRLASVCINVTDLAGKVAISIMNAKNEIERSGWQRIDMDVVALQQENIDLRKQIDQLKEQMENSKKDNEVEEESFSFLSEEVELNYSEVVYMYPDNRDLYKFKIKKTLEQLFKDFSIKVSPTVDNKTLVESFNDTIRGIYCYLNEEDVNKVFLKFNKYELIKNYNIGEIDLTPKGEELRDRLHNI